MKALPYFIAVVGLNLLGAGASAQQDRNANSADGITTNMPQPSLDVTYIANEGFLIQARRYSLMLCLKEHQPIFPLRRNC